MGLFRRKKRGEDRGVSVWRDWHGREGLFAALNVTAAKDEARRAAQIFREREGREPTEDEFMEASTLAFANPENWVDMDNIDRRAGPDDLIGFIELDPETGRFVQFVAAQGDGETDDFDDLDLDDEGPEITQELIDQILEGDFSAFDAPEDEPEPPRKRISPDARAKRQAEIDAIRASYESDADSDDLR